MRTATLPIVLVSLGGLFASAGCTSPLDVPPVVAAAKAGCDPSMTWGSCLAHLNGTATDDGRANVQAFSKVAYAVCEKADTWDTCATKVAAATGDRTTAPADPSAPKGSFAKPYGD